MCAFLCIQVNKLSILVSFFFYPSWNENVGRIKWNILYISESNGRSTFFLAVCQWNENISRMDKHQLQKRVFVLKHWRERCNAQINKISNIFFYLRTTFPPSSILRFCEMGFIQPPRKTFFICSSFCLSSFVICYFSMKYRLLEAYTTRIETQRARKMYGIILFSAHVC